MNTRANQGLNNPSDYSGIIIANFGKTAIVKNAHGQLFHCDIRRRATRPVSGDRVRWRRTDSHGGIIVAVQPRENALGRPDRRGRTRVMAANLDRIGVVVAPQPAFQEILIDRYLIAAAYFNIPPLILLNKTDLLTREESHAFSARLEVYRQLGYPICQSSIKTKGKLDDLQTILQKGTSMLVGQSGVGKSSLIQCLAPEARITVEAINQTALLGRHTTSATTLYNLPGGGNIIDSPGVRDFGLWHLPEEKIAPGFMEFREYLGKCRFRNCRHREEPDCALKEAVGSGSINPQRFNNYHLIMDSLKPDSWH